MVEGILAGYEKKLDTSYSISDLKERRGYLKGVIKKFQKEENLAPLFWVPPYEITEDMRRVADLEKKLLRTYFDANAGSGEKHNWLDRFLYIGDNSKYLKIIRKIEAREFILSSSNISYEELHKPFTI